MLFRLFACLLTASLLISGSLLAQEHRFVGAEAIITRALKSDRRFRTAAEGLSRIEKPSFNALAYQHLSAIATRVVLKRKIRNYPQDSRRYSKTRNPCNSAAIKRLLRTAPTLVCEPNWVGSITAVAPNDTLQSNVYAASLTSAARIHLPEAWELSTGSTNVVVAVIDTGIDYTHPDLAANIWTNPGEIAANGIDEDGNGFVDDLHGIDTFNGDSDPFDDQSHGTHVAGTIGASGNNSQGVAGIAWNVKQIGCKAFNSSGSGTSSAIISCLNYIVNIKNNLGINIVATNNSYGGFPYSVSTYNAIEASRAAGIVFVAGAGNSTSDNDASPFYPASYELDNIISVGALDSLANISSFSNFGASSVDIFAPGVAILSTIPGNQYAYYQGTSMATPHITGVIALLMAYHPSYDYSQARSSVLNTGTVLAALTGKSVSGALVNAEAALNYVAPIPTPSPIPTVVPSPTPTAGPDFSTARLDISVAAKSKSKSLVSCTLSALSGTGYQALSGYKVSLPIKGARAMRSSTTNEQGSVKFTVRPVQGRVVSVRCSASLSDPATGVVAIIKSRSVKIKSGVRRSHSS